MIFEQCLDERGRITRHCLLEFLIETDAFRNLSKRLYHYEEAKGAWCDVTNQVPNRAILQYIPQTYQSQIDASRVRRMVADLINSVQLEAIFHEDQTMLNLQNGVLNIKTLELHPHNRKYTFRYMRNFNFIKEAKLDNAPIFASFITSSLGEAILSKAVDEALEIIGYTISQLRNAKKSVFLLGESNCGKSVFLKLLSTAFDLSEVSCVGLHELSAAFRCATLEFSHVNLLHELKPVRIKCVDEFKKIVSGEPILLENKGKAARPVSLQTLFVSATNLMPIFDATELNRSLTNRILLLKFNGSIADDQIIRNLSEQLEQEKDVIFSVALQRLHELLKRNLQFVVPDSTRAFLEAYARQQNSVSLFIEDCCIVGPDQKCFSRDLYRAYLGFVEKNLLYKHKATAVGNMVRSLSGVVNKKIRIGHELLQGYEGIGLKNHMDDQDTGL